MKKVLLTLAISGLLSFSFTSSFAQNDGAAPTENVDQATSEDQANATPAEAEPAQQEEVKAQEPVSSGNMADDTNTKQSGHAVLKKYFIDGGWEFMTTVLLCLIFGLGFAIERLIVLTLNRINLKSFINSIEIQLKNGNVENAKNIARNTRGPVASIYYQGLERYKEGIEMVEKSIVSYGSVQMGQLEKGLIWISLFISLAPMLGFLGTVIGMIIAFDQIQAMGDINPSAVAGGIKVALITTVGGLIVAIILQIFYNLIVSIIDGMVNTMEDASITLVDMLIKYGLADNTDGTTVK